MIEEPSIIQGLIETFRQTVSGQMENQFLSATLIMGALTAMAMSLKTLPSKLWVLFINRFTTNVYVDSTQDTYGWVHIWMSHQNFGKKARRISIRVKGDVYESDDIVRKSADTKARSRIVFSLGEGTHYVRYAGKWLMLNLHREQPKSGNSGNFMAVYESITIRYFGTSRNILNEIIDEAVGLVTPPSDNWIDVFLWGGWHSGDRIKRKRGRDPETLMYQEGIFDDIHGDIVKFNDSYDWYSKLGIPYKKTFLLHGPPGSGKTSLALALATKLRYSLYNIDLSSGDGNVNALLFCLGNIPKHSIVLIEDIHTVGASKENRPTEEAPLSLSIEGLTNVIDGALSAEGIILLMTTNYPDLLDDRLIRPGRIDKKVYIGNADHFQIENLAKKFYPEANGEIKEFVSTVDEDLYSMAQLQEFFIRNPQIGQILKNRSLLDAIKSDSIADMKIMAETKSFLAAQKNSNADEPT